MEKVEDFVKSVSGYGSGNGNGYGNGDGSGFGSGFGSGSGDGYGYGSGDGYGYGYGYGSGSGDGYGYGNGYGSGSGDGYGNGYGSGSGDGDGYGDGIKSYNGQDVYLVDNIQTLITNIHGNIAKGFILQDDLTLKPCYIAKGNGYFAHGETAKKAVSALQEKIYENMDSDEAIQEFIKAFSEDKKYPASEFYIWHHRLTGSCEMGRNQFAEEHGIDLDKDMMTVREFIELTENSYGCEVIRKLKEEFGRRKK